MTSKRLSPEPFSSPQKKEEYDHNFVELQEQISLFLCQKNGGSWGGYLDDNPVSSDEFFLLHSQASQCMDAYLQEGQEKLPNKQHEELSVLFTQLLTALEEDNIKNERKKLPVPMTSLLHRMNEILQEGDGGTPKL